MPRYESDQEAFRRKMLRSQRAQERHLAELASEARGRSEARRYYLPAQPLTASELTRRRRARRRGWLQFGFILLIFAGIPLWFMTRAILNETHAQALRDAAHPLPVVPRTLTLFCERADQRGRCNLKDPHALCNKKFYIGISNLSAKEFNDLRYTVTGSASRTTLQMRFMI
jgi:hypothetical protein